MFPEILSIKKREGKHGTIERVDGDLSLEQDVV